MPDQTVNVPIGPNVATVKVLDANGSDITGTCTVTAVSSDPAIISIGALDPTNPADVPFTSLVEGKSATITYVATNPQGTIQEVDTLNIAVTAPASMTVTYKTTVASVAAAIKK